jgi:ubiquinone/menaquinone biosynthesis C-methylase UbiE
VGRTARPWNHNTHHHRLLLRLLPARPGAAVDIGCGDGSFAALLGERCGTVLALDVDPVQVEIARGRCAVQPNVRVEQGDFLAAGLPAGGFDAVTALASLHHMPFRAAAEEVARVLRPGGRLIVLGVWTDRGAVSAVLPNVVSAAMNIVLRWSRGPDVMCAPVVMPTMSLREVRRSAHHLLPGARIRRRVLWRYTLTWVKPRSDDLGTSQPP